MAKARTLDKRRKAIRNIHKITRTMELISRANFSRAMARAVSATAYTKRITALVGHLARSGLNVTHPLMQPHEPVRSGVLLVLTSNRGLCGGYNAAVFRLAASRWNAMVEEMPGPCLEVVGKRGISAFRFRGVQPRQSFTHFNDKPAFAEVEVLANRYQEEYLAGRLDRLEIAYTRFESLSRQVAVVETLLPLGALVSEEVGGNDANHGASPAAYEFFPSPEAILEEVVPTSFKIKLFKCFLDAAVSEQIARMTAMKAATENAEAMIEALTMTYNRARQGQITSEMLEVLGGAEALNE